MIEDKDPSVPSQRQMNEKVGEHSFQEYAEQPMGASENHKDREA